MSTSSKSSSPGGGTATVVSGAHGLGRSLTESTYTFNTDWSITVLKGAILPSNCYCDSLDENNTKGLCLETGRKFQEEGSNDGVNKCQVCRFNDSLALKHLPEMVFPDNILSLHHVPSGLVLQFNTMEAMRLMGAAEDCSSDVRVAAAEVWQASRAGLGLPKEKLHDFNWTFTTKYQGSLKRWREDALSPIDEADAEEGGFLRMEANSPEKLNMAKLMRKEQILFYDQLTLYEDELSDNGISNCNIKIRVMPSGFFILLRYFLRVDHVMAKVCDSRIHFEVGNPYFLRQYQVREEFFKNLSHLSPQTFGDMDVLYNHLPVQSETTQKIYLQKE